MGNLKKDIQPESFDAVLFDLDGVVTRTADTHAEAWKKLFDEYFSIKFGPKKFNPFDIKSDYLKYVDGRPRYKGVDAFISSRDIDLPFGTVNDDPELETICGLGNRKNQIFRKILSEKGIKVYESTIHLIHQLRKNGFKTAIVSSSKNCRPVLKAAGLEALFDTRVDGVVSERLGLKGKPKPDIFLEAAKRLRTPAERCVVVEDAISGVAAGQKGEFGMVIGVNRGDIGEQLKKNGADLVVDDLVEIRSGILAKNLPHALESFGRIINLIAGKEILIFLNYETILYQMPFIIEEEVFIKKAQEILAPLVRQTTVFIFTKKKLDQILKMLTLDNINIIASDGCSIAYNQEAELGFELPVPIYEQKKGEAITRLLKELHLVSKNIFPIFIGDHIIDENAFYAVKKNGVAIGCGKCRYTSKASFRLDSLGEVRKFLTKLSPNLERGTSWNHIYMGFDPEDEGRREALCAIGNGYFVTRASAPESNYDDIHYPGTYLAGVYNRLNASIEGRTVENENLVNIPNWLCFNFRIEGESWFNLSQVEILFYRKYLYIRSGILYRTIRFRDQKGRETIMLQQSFVHADQMHKAGLKVIITALNWDGKIEVCSAIDGSVTNKGVKRYQGLGHQNLELVKAKHLDNNHMALKVITNQSRVGIAMAAKTEFYFDEKKLTLESKAVDKKEGYLSRHFNVNLKKGMDLTIEKLVSVYTSKDTGITECLMESEHAIKEQHERFDDLIKSHITSWQLLWRKFDVKVSLVDENIEQYTQKIIRLYIYHLLQSSSIHSLDIDVGLPARGWHGEGYRGHIFWDEMIIFPILNYRMPRITRTLLMYRYRRLNEARLAAAREGNKGAMYPWQSGSNGREETQKLHLNPRSGRWLPDNTHLQRHVNNAIVYNIWQYFEISQDIDFLATYGGEIIIEIARFWVSIATYNSEIDRYEIHGVMGPDEYHDSYPGADQPGLNNNAYTNLMVMFVMDQALNLRNIIPEMDWDYLKRKLSVEEKELSIWKKMSRRMKIPFHGDGIISQFEGYENLKEFDWHGYRKKYRDIKRLDRILEKEGDSANNYKLSKQADVLMIFYLFSAEKLKKMFKRLDYKLDDNFILKNINYYLNRTSDGSSLAFVIHAWIEARLERESSWSSFSRALETDMIPERTGSTHEGVHLAAMSGCIDILQRGYAGLEIRSDILILNPLLPDTINGICFHIRYRKHWLDIEINHQQVRVKSLTSKAKRVTVMIKDEIIRLYPGKTAVVDI